MCSVRIVGEEVCLGLPPSTHSVALTVARRAAAVGAANAPLPTRRQRGARPLLEALQQRHSRQQVQVDRLLSRVAAALLSLPPSVVIHSIRCHGSETRATCDVDAYGVQT